MGDRAGFVYMHEPEREVAPVPELQVFQVPLLSQRGSEIARHR